MSPALSWQLVEWRQPLWLLLALQPFVLLLLRQLWRWRHPSAYAEPALLPWVRRRDRRSLLTLPFSRTGAHVLAWALLAVAAAGPRLPEELPGQSLRDGAQVLIALDLSRSMEAGDSAPSRFKRARIELLELLSRARVDRFGILPFAGRPHLLVPPTADYAALRHYLGSLRPRVLPTAGSGLGPALEQAADLLADSDTPAAVLLVSDGEAADPDRARAAARALGAAGIPLYVLGVGSEEATSLPDGDGGWLEHDGRPVITRLHRTLLEELAAAADGSYASVAADDSEWRVLYDRGIATLSSHRIASDQAQRIRWHELYPWALLPGLVLLAVSLFPMRARALAALGALALVVTAAPLERTAQAADAADLERHAHAAFQAGDYHGARDAYARLAGYAARMGEGAAAYRLGDSAAAAGQFAQAVLAADNDPQRARALLNLGNSRFQLGDYGGAVEAYRDALRYRPEYPAARTNLALAEDLYAAVQERLARPAPAAPPGRGPRPGDAGADAEGGRFLMEPTPMPDPEVDEELPEAAANGGDDLAALIARGLRHAQQAAARTDVADTLDRVAQPGDVAAARARARRARPDLGEYWRGLFAFEEGFPAAPDEPQPLPGTDPW